MVALWGAYFLARALVALPWPFVAPMTAPAACGLILGAVGVWLLAELERPLHRLGLALFGLALTGLGVWILKEDLAGSALRPVPQAAITFVLLGLGLAASGSARTARAGIWGFLPATALIPYVVLVGYLFQLTHLGGLASQDMALLTATGLFVLAIAAMAATAEHGPLRELTLETSGGAMARRLLAPMVAVPPLLIWLVLAGLRGRLWGIPESAAILAIGLTTGGLAATAWNVHSLDRMDQALQAKLELERLRELERYRTRLLALFWHELRTPLSAITGFADLLGDEASGRLSAVQRQYLAGIETGAGSLLKLVSNILDLSEAALGELKLDRGAVELADIARSALQALAPQAQAKGQILEADLPDVGLAQLDADRIGRALGELLENAIKFTPGGGKIRLAVSRLDGHVTAEIADNGPGMAPEELESALLRFVQLDMSATRPAGGLGLGLSFAKTIVEAHGGTLDIRSQPSQGTRCIVSLPR